MKKFLNYTKAIYIILFILCILNCFVFAQNNSNKPNVSVNSFVTKQGVRYKVITNNDAKVRSFNNNFSNESTSQPIQFFYPNDGLVSFNMDDYFKNFDSMFKGMMNNLEMTTVNLDDLTLTSQNSLSSNTVSDSKNAADDIISKILGIINEDVAPINDQNILNLNTKLTNTNNKVDNASNTKTPETTPKLDIQTEPKVDTSDNKKPITPVTNKNLIRKNISSMSDEEVETEIRSNIFASNIYAVTDNNGNIIKDPKVLKDYREGRLDKNLFKPKYVAIKNGQTNSRQFLEIIRILEKNNKNNNLYKNLTKNNLSVHTVSKGISEMYPDLKGQKPEGFPEGATFDNAVSGVFMPIKKGIHAVSTNSVVKGKDVLDPRVIIKHSTPNLEKHLIHELGHSIDIMGYENNKEQVANLNGYYSSKVDFQSSRKKEFEKLTPYEKLYRFTSLGEKETFAERYALYIINTPIDIKYLENGLLTNKKFSILDTPLIKEFINKDVDQKGKYPYHN